MPFSQCGFWAKIMKDAFADPDAIDADAMRELRRRAHQAAMAGKRGAPVAEYAAILERLLRGVAACDGATTIVDSSKNPGHGAVLLAAAGLDVRVVHLVRDPRGVANSLGRQHTMSGQAISMARCGPVKAAMHWRRENRRTASLTGNAILLRYEELVAEPQATFSRLLQQLDEPAETSTFLNGAVAMFAEGHSLCGNPMRHRGGPVEIRNDDAWRRRMPAWRQRLVSLLTRGPARSYGYPRAATGNAGLLQADGQIT
jgi:hypothetical protein